MDSNKVEWVHEIEEGLITFLHSLQVPDQPGKFLPCLQGVRKRAKKISLGFSCFALKLYYMLGLWDALDSQTQNTWIAFLKSFQSSGKFWQNRILRNAFIDPPVIEYLQKRLPWCQRLTQNFFFSRAPAHPQKIIIAETKQTLATLMQVGESADRAYLGFPLKIRGVRHYMLHTTSWTRPWGAGGYTSALAVFLKSEAPKVLAPNDAQELLATCSQIFGSLAHKETGAYFTGPPPEYGQLINGAMKVLTALDWLEVPIHYPEQLIDTCLTQFPTSDGCHVVDAVYVLYRCLQQTQHRKAEIQQYCLKVLEMIKQHHNPDGGFSYFIGQSQTSYYSVPISKGRAESDIHGTILLTWALAMIVHILEIEVVDWRVIKP
jgi:hypothetical protein